LTISLGFKSERANPNTFLTGDVAEPCSEPGAARSSLYALAKLARGRRTPLEESPDEDVQPSKTVWDLLQLLIVAELSPPLVSTACAEHASLGGAELLGG
jgi:hypothetical protein